MPKSKPNALQKLVRGAIRSYLAPKRKKKRVVVDRLKPAQPSQPQKTTRSISLTTRYLILKRDNRQCVICGRQPPAVKLEIDHIIPYSKGGSNHPSNLQTLCFDCNRGKGANP
ncbi:HNH endonuclease [Pseudanabaena sp. PCC 6802]|uniref:HNH endonuclease n=1 Tax=Pseudanabaena sp. PCC 6802 TaxID=118173 RepID=UPI000A05CE99|nr:HNH endonuclease [Pseudanabaena sp. PCC 6802]